MSCGYHERNISYIQVLNLEYRVKVSTGLLQFLVKSMNSDPIRAFSRNLEHKLTASKIEHGIRSVVCNHFNSSKQTQIRFVGKDRKMFRPQD